MQRAFLIIIGMIICISLINNDVQSQEHTIPTFSYKGILKRLTTNGMNKSPKWISNNLVSYVHITGTRVETLVAKRFETSIETVYNEVYQGDLEIVNINIGNRQNLRNIGLSRIEEYAWLDGGKKIIFVQNGKLWLMNIEDKTRQFLANKMAVEISVSPDESKAAFVAEVELHKYELYVVDLHHNRVQKVKLPVAALISDLQWISNNEIVYTLGEFEEGWCDCIKQPARLWYTELNKMTSRQISFTDAWLCDHSPCISLDKKTIAFACCKEKSDLWLMDVYGKNLTRVTHNKGVNPIGWLSYNELLLVNDWGTELWIVNLEKETFVKVLSCCAPLWTKVLESISISPDKSKALFIYTTPSGSYGDVWMLEWKK